MFRKIFIIAMFATAAGYCFAAENPPQVVTSEVFYTEEKQVDETQYARNDTQQHTVQKQVQEKQSVPAWPIACSDADMEVGCNDLGAAQTDSIKIVSKIGNDLILENNFNLGVRGSGWSGGANLLHGTQIPVGFDDECNSGSEMPLLHREMLEDDGGSVLAVSRSGRKNCGVYADSYTAFAEKTGMDKSDSFGDTKTEEEISVDVSAAAESTTKAADQVHSWVVANGQTLREVLQDWSNKEGWDLVWATSREYPIEASAVFKGRFIDVASALVRNFERATPIPYAKFYKGNRVLVVSTSEE